MIEIEINKQNLIAFLKDIKKEDKEELVFSYPKNYKEKFIDVCLKNTETTYFLADNMYNPLIIGGYIITNVKTSVIWLLSTNKIEQHKKEVFKYITEKINIFKKENDILYNYIYKSNFKALKWLGKLGFAQKDIMGRFDYKIFYYTKGENFDIRHITCK